MFDAKGDTNYLKQKLNQNIAAGEKLSGAEFEMRIDQYPDLMVLIRSTQLGAMGRADMEDFGPMGLKVNQYGPLENSGEIAVTAVETITGRVLDAIRDAVKNKRYLDVTIRATPESASGGTAAPLKFRYEYCKIRSDVIDLSTEDQTAFVKPAMTIVYNWCDI